MTFGEEEEHSAETPNSEPNSAESISSNKESVSCHHPTNRLLNPALSLINGTEEALLTLREVEREPGSPIKENDLVEACLGDFMSLGGKQKNRRTPRFRKKKTLRGIDFAQAVLGMQN